jgi:hypothetical protein
MPVSSSGRLPRARLDPIYSAAEAMAIFAAQMTKPLRPETLVMYLDDAGRGSTLVTVTGTDDPFQIVEIAETMALSGNSHPNVCGLVLASVRPGGRVLPGDDELWLEAADVVADIGLVLVDWLIIGRDGTVSPRELLGMPSRWPCGT